jgi:nitroreductase
MAKEFFETVEARRSVRRYTPSVVPEEVVRKALAAALKAPNSSNIQPWEFYWVKSASQKSALIEACFSQGAARTASHLVVAVSRLDTWKRNRDLLLKQMEKDGPLSADIKTYYTKLVPFMYMQDPTGISALVKWLALNLIGLFRPMVRGPFSRQERFETVTKTTALACENFMLAIAAQGYGSCPMEGFDSSRVKKILKLGYSARIVMVISVGETDPAGIFGPQYRIDPKLVIHEI